jgi:uncharacterized protein YndB with AHSA1/START domain
MATRAGDVWHIDIRADAERVWDVITKTGVAQEFYFGSVLHTSLEPGSGLRYVSTNGRLVFIEGSVVEVDPPRRLVHMFRMTNIDEPATRVTWSLDPAGEGVRVTITHDELGERTRSTVGRGWPRILRDLKAYVERGRVPVTTRFFNGVMGVLGPLLVRPRPRPGP